MFRILILIFMLFGFSTQISAKKFGLVLGSNYKGNKAGISELQLCEADATYISDQIKKLGNFDEVKVVLGKELTKSNVEKEIRDLGAKAKPDDVVFLYFAGHGFFQRDANAKNGMRNFIVMYERPHLADDELNDYLKTIKSPKTIFAFDCCYSGGIAKKGAKTRGDKDIPIPSGSDGVVKQGSEDFYFQNKAILSSADDNQTAIELGGDINHGIFTYYFGRALESGDLNGDKVVTALEAFYKSKDDVSNMARQVDHEQTPQISGDASGVILIGTKNDIVKPDKDNIIKPVPNEDKKPEPVPDPPKPDPVVDPVPNKDEPPANQTNLKGSLLIRTTIIKDRAYGIESLPPDEMIKQRKKRVGARNVKALVDGLELPQEILSIKSSDWGSLNKFGTNKSGEVYHILIKEVPSGVHRITLKADEYPEVGVNFAVIADKENILDMTNSMSGFGAIRGKIFYKTLDNPVINHKVYMPTVKSVTNNQTAKTDENGNFWFTNLLPGEYEIRASFAETLKLENSMIKVKEGEVTQVDIILGTKLPGMKTKH